MFDLSHNMTRVRQGAKMGWARIPASILVGSSTFTNVLAEWQGRRIILHALGISCETINVQAVQCTSSVRLSRVCVSSSTSVPLLCHRVSCMSLMVKGAQKGALLL